MQGHLGGHARQRLRQKVRSAHPHLERAEGMLGRLAAYAHRLRVLIETLLHGFEHVFMLPSCDPAFRPCRAARFEGTARTSRRPIATQRLAVLLVLIPIS